MTRGVNSTGQNIRLCMLALALILSLAPAPAQDLRAAGELLSSGHSSQAEALLIRLKTTRPADPAVWNLLGAAYAQQGKYAQAESAFRSALKLEPRSAPVWLNLGRVYKLQTDRSDAAAQALEAYRTVLKLQPDNAEAHHEMAVLLQWSGQFAESLSHLNLLPVQDQERRSVLAVRAADELALGHRDSGLSIANKLLADPECGEADIAAVLPVIEAHDSEAAESILESLASRKLAGPESLGKLGDLCEKHGNPSGAKRAYTRQFESNPKSAVPLMALARLAWKEKDYEATLSYLAHARDLDPGNASIWFLFGLAANELKLPGQARDAMLKAVQLAPENPFYNYAMGVLQLQWREKDAAVEYLARYVAARPADPRGRLALGAAYLNLARLPEARRELTPVASGGSDVQGGAEFLLGRIAFQEGDLPSAVRFFQQAARHDPSSADAKAELGAALLKLDRVAEAEHVTTEALRLDRDHYVANMNLLRLYRLRKDQTNVEVQSARIKNLAEQHDTDLRYLQRSIEFRPH